MRLPLPASPPPFPMLATASQNSLSDHASPVRCENSRLACVNSSVYGHASRGSFERSNNFLIADRAASGYFAFDSFVANVVLHGSGRHGAITAYRQSVVCPCRRKPHIHSSAIRCQLLVERDAFATKSSAARRSLAWRGRRWSAWFVASWPSHESPQWSRRFRVAYARDVLGSRGGREVLWREPQLAKSRSIAYKVTPKGP